MLNVYEMHVQDRKLCIVVYREYEAKLSIFVFNGDRHNSAQLQHHRNDRSPLWCSGKMLWKSKPHVRDRHICLVDSHTV